MMLSNLHDVFLRHDTKFYQDKEFIFINFCIKIKNILFLTLTIKIFSEYENWSS